jgi:hypothetical protein
MTRIEMLRIAWSDVALISCIDNMEVTKDQLETIIDGWLVLDDGQFDMQPDASTLYARIVRLKAIRYFSTSKKIDDDRLIFGCELPGKQYRYYVK